MKMKPGKYNFKNCLSVLGSAVLELNEAVKPS